MLDKDVEVISVHSDDEDEHEKKLHKYSASPELAKKLSKRLSDRWCDDDVDEPFIESEDNGYHPDHPQSPPRAFMSAAKPQVTSNGSDTSGSPVTMRTPTFSHTNNSHHASGGGIAYRQVSNSNNNGSSSRGSQQGFQQPQQQHGSWRASENHHHQSTGRGNSMRSNNNGNRSNGAGTAGSVGGRGGNNRSGNMVCHGSKKFNSTALEVSSVERQFLVTLRDTFFPHAGSIAVVVLKAAIEASPHVAMYKEVMTPYQNSLHSFFERHSDDFYLWNYSAPEITQFELAPYFKTDETRVAVRRQHIEGDVILSRESIHVADQKMALGMKQEENDILKALVDILTQCGESLCSRKDALLELKSKFPSCTTPGGLLSSANSFHRFVMRHPEVVTNEATSLRLVVRPS